VCEISLACRFSLGNHLTASFSNQLAAQEPKSLKKASHAMLLVSERQPFKLHMGKDDARLSNELISVIIKLERK
jgi:hypothetical protein